VFEGKLKRPKIASNRTMCECNRTIGLQHKIYLNFQHGCPALEIIVSTPTEQQIVKLKSLPADEPVGALNLFYFNTRAQYQPEDLEYGTPMADVTGKEAFDRYSKSAGKHLSELGGELIFYTQVDQVMIGPADPPWDVAAVMFFPTRGAFIKMLADPDYQSESRHRKAALANHTMFHLAGASFLK